MSDTKSGLMSCRNTCWIAGALLGLVVFLLVMKSSVIFALILGVAVAVAIAFVLRRLFCIGVDVDRGVMGSGATDAGGATLAALGADKTRSRSDVPGAGEGERSPEAAAAAHAEATAAAAGNLGEGASTMESAALDNSNAAAASQKSETPLVEPQPKAAKPAAPAPAPKAATPAQSETKSGSAGPELLDAPRGGKADDLKQIKGVGPKFEKLLNETGVWHFEQIASWKAADIAIVDAKLVGFHGRIERDGWVEQAKALAQGEETEFSKRVKKGDVY